MSSAYETLKSRGFIYQATADDKIQAKLAEEKVTFYVGFDPTGDSLHVGHLLPIMAMKKLQEAGHTPIVLVGGATALVGDPSGKSEARPIITKETVAHNVEALKKQLSNFISVDDAIFVNNADWFIDLNYIDFLREVGSRFSVNKMLTAESVKQRLETGLSFLEFNYMLLQAYDFSVLNKRYNCSIQFGGQDQWGNIVAGVDLTRRLNQEEVFGLTFPLLLDSQGKKFGKTAGGAVWLDPAKTSTFEYYQFWRNCDDADVEKLLYFFTDLPVDEVKSLAALEAPAINRAKEILAYEATKLAHGAAEAEKSYIAAGSKFGFADNSIKTSSSINDIVVTKDSGLEDLPTYTIPAEDFVDGQIGLLKLLSTSGLCASNGDARRLVQGGGGYINEKRIADPKYQVTSSDFTNGSLVLRAGKKKVRRILIG